MSPYFRPMSPWCPPILFIVIKKREGNLLFNFTFHWPFRRNLAMFPIKDPPVFCPIWYVRFTVFTD